MPLPAEEVTGLFKGQILCDSPCSVLKCDKKVNGMDRLYAETKGLQIVTSDLRCERFSPWYVKHS